jgi:hypothetical protein
VFDGREPYAVSERMDIDAKTKAALRENYDRLANEPAAWLVIADNLACSARLLEPYFSVDPTKETDHQRIALSARVQGPILMLRGCGLECLLKALFVAKGNTLGKSGRFVSPGGKAHDLVKLAEKAQFLASPTESSLLAHLGHYIEQGRYPMVKRAPETYAVRADGTRREAVWSRDDEQQSEQLRVRLRAEVVRVAVTK